MQFIVILIKNDNRCCATSRDFLNNSTTKIFCADIVSRRSLQRRFVTQSKSKWRKLLNHYCLASNKKTMDQRMLYCCYSSVYTFKKDNCNLHVSISSVLCERERERNSKRPKISVVFSRQFNRLSLIGNRQLLLVCCDRVLYLFLDFNWRSGKFWFVRAIFRVPWIRWRGAIDCVLFYFRYCAHLNWKDIVICRTIVRHWY